VSILLDAFALIALLAEEPAADEVETLLRRGEPAITAVNFLIAKGLTVLFVSRQLGHANPTVTLSAYAHLFERADHAQAARAALEASYKAMAASRGS
jgi:PIN domain nuclease of toxin-antitoxin system